MFALVKAAEHRVGGGLGPSLTIAARAAVVGLGRDGGSGAQSNRGSFSVAAAGAGAGHGAAARHGASRRSGTPSLHLTSNRKLRGGNAAEAIQADRKKTRSHPSRKPAIIRQFRWCVYAPVFGTPCDTEVLVGSPPVWPTRWG